MSAVDYSAADYHADKIAPRPSLSKSIAHILITQSPAHAKAAHPRLNPQFVREEEAKFDVGTAAHALLLEGDDGVYVVHADDWRTKVAKEERDIGREMGKTVLLARHWLEVQAMVAACRDQLALIDAEPPLFSEFGKAERTLVWKEPNGISCKARLDWLHDDLTAIDDYKTTARSASPEAWSKSCYGIGADLQVAFYLRGFKAVYPDAPAPLFRFVAQETTSPYALTVFSLSPAALELANTKAEWAIAMWADCLERNEWPAYPTRVCHIEPPAWEENRWYERTYRDEVAA